MVIGKIRLARSQAAFYDELSRIQLTLSRPTADVHSNMNTAGLRRGVSYKTIELVAGTLVISKEVVIDEKAKEKEAKEATIEEVKEEIKKPEKKPGKKANVKGKE